MVGRLLDHLQQRVEGVRAEHVDLVDDVDPPPQLGRRGQRPHHQLAGILDQAMAGGVDLDHVHGAPFAHGHAGRAGVARLAVLAAVGAVDGLGQDAGRGGLARAARPDEQVGVRGAVGGHGATQGGDDRILAEHLGETLRSPAAVQRPMLVGGGGRSWSGYRTPNRRLAAKAMAAIRGEWSRPCTRCRSRAPAHAKIVRLQPGRPTAPEGGRLPLLPSGPDGVRGPSLRGTRLSTSGDLVGGGGSSGLDREFSPAVADCGCRAPLVPRLARPPRS